MKIIVRMNNINIKSYQKIKEVVAIILSLHCSFAIAQLPSKEIIPLSPNTAQLGIFGTVPVGLFTGTVQQSIPLYEFKTHNLSLPITLSYSSNGLIVDKVASWVGFDWSLDAGGAITCNVKGKPDYLYPRSDVPEGIENNLPNFRSYLESHFMGDQQPDIFSFNFGGNVGKFILNYNGTQAYTIPFQKLKIGTTRTDGDMTKGKDFIITTPDGVKYVFDKVEQYIGIAESYPVSWYLSTITHPAGDIINFYYTQPALATYYPGVSQTISRFLNASGNATPPADPPDSPIAQSVNNMSFFLDSIKSPGYGTVIFKKTGNRTDFYNGQRLNQVIIKNNQNQTIKNVQLKYHYVVNSNYYGVGLGINFTGSTGNNQNIQNELKYRMFLDTVYFNDSQNRIIQSYKFNYLNLDNLPPRLSFSQDHWGFFNGASNNYLTPAYAIPSGYEGKFPTGIYCDREANAQYSQNGLMSKITYPTGGYSIMEYEPHNNGTQDIGGVRIKRVTTYESASSVPMIKRYYYPNCYGRGIPTYYYAFKSYSEVYTSYVTNYHGAIVSNSLYSIYNSDQGSAVYPTVKVSIGENYEGGGELHSFDVTTDIPAFPANQIGGGSIVPVPYSNVAWYNGTKRSETLFKKNNSGQFINVKSTSYNYDRADSRYNKECIALAIVKNQPPPNQEIGRDILKDYAVFKYRVYSTWNKPNSTIETVYDDSGNAVVSSTAYSYDDLNKGHAQLSREIITNSNGDVITKKYFYPWDYNGVTFLKDPFMIGKILESRTYNNSKLIQLDQYMYNSQGQVFQYFKADLGNNGTDIPFNPNLTYSTPLKITFNYSNSNIVTVNPTDNVKTAYIWGYSQAYPVVKIDGIDYADISSTVKSNISSRSFTTHSGYSNVKVDVDYLKGQLASLISDSKYSVTFYTYSPLIGMTSQTDPNGVTTYYEYDNFGRLKWIKDDDGNILKTFDYHYSGQTK